MGRVRHRIGKHKSQTRRIPTREAEVAGVTVVVTGRRVQEEMSNMSDDDTSDDSDRNRREFEKARVADTPDGDPRRESTETAEAEASQTGSDDE